MKKLKKIRLESLTSERFNVMASFEMDSLRGGQGSGTSGTSGSGVVDFCSCGEMETVTVTASGLASAGCDSDCV